MTIEFDGEHAEDAIAWRHYLPRNPELAFEDHRTSAFIAGPLSDWGYEVKTGLLATRGDGRSPGIGIRADLAAQPGKEITGAAHASRVASCTPAAPANSE